MTWVEEGMYLFASPFVLANILVLLCEDLVDLFDDGDFFFFGFFFSFDDFGDLRFNNWLL